jgi:hypothetical protein
VRFALLALLAGCSFQPGMYAETQPDRDAPLDDMTTADTGSVDGSPDATMTLLREKTITIAPTVVGTHADFPLWVSLTDADIAARATSTGADIHFVANGAPLDFEIQSWTQSTGRLDAWVRVPSLAAGTVLAVRYGDTSAAHQANPAGVFTGYAAVWHLEDALTTTTVVDARDQANGTAVNLDSADSVTAQLGRGIDFDDSTDQITFTNALTGTGSSTISVWIDQATTTTNDAIIAFGNGATNQARWFHSRYNSATIAVGFYANDYANPSEDIIGDGWVLLNWVYDGPSRMSRLYRGSALVAGPFQHASGVNTQGTAGTIGNAPAAYGTNMGLNATLDELRVIGVARSADWIAAEASNQTTPATFYTVGTEQIP